MNIAPVAVEERDGQITRAARVTWDGGDLSLWCRGRKPVIDATDDASAFVCAALPVAMSTAQPLTVEGPLGEPLATRLTDLQAVYHAWNPSWAIVDLEVVAAESTGAGPHRPSVSFFSRGVDSMFTAAVGEADALLFGDHLEPRHDDEVRAEEIRRARTVAELLGRELVVVDTNVRTFTDLFGTDWEDVNAAGLSFLAHSVAAGYAAAIVPSSDTYETVEPCGTSPLLDPLFSTDRMKVAHGTIAYTRLGKLRWLRDAHPEVLPFVKVCYFENRPDNCGRCGKCLHTMACLFAIDALEQATEFPSDLDVELVRRLRLPHLKARIDWSEVAAALRSDGKQGALRDAITDTLRSSTVDASYRSTTADPWVPHRWTRDNRLNLTLSLVLEGRPYPSESDDQPLTLLEIAGRRPEYRLGSLPYPGRVRELGALVARPLPGAIPVWVTVDGEVHTRGMQPPRRGGARGLWSRRGTVHDPDQATAGEPSGYLHRRGGPDRIPLYAAWHQLLGHQVLHTAPDRDARLLGYLEAPPGP